MARRYKRFAALAFAALAGFAGACDDGELPDAPSEPAPLSDAGELAAFIEQVELTSVEIFPSRVVAAVGNQFVLRAQISGKIDNYPTVLDELASFNPVWSGDFPRDPGEGYRVTISAGSNPTSGMIRVVVDGYSSVAYIDVVSTSNSGSLGLDLVTDATPHDETEPIPMALIQGAADAADCPNWLAVAFVAVAVLGNLSENCLPAQGEVFEFAYGRGYQHQSLSWTSEGDVVAFPVVLSNGGAPVAPAPSGYKVVFRMAATSQQGYTTLKAILTTELNRASAVFDTNRVGIQFPAGTAEFDDVRPFLGNWSPPNVGTWNADRELVCENLPEYTSPEYTNGSLVGSENLTVIVVEDLGVDDDMGYGGVACPPHSVRGQVIFVSALGLEGATLAHELAHAFAGQENTSRQQGFTTNNLLGASDESQSAAARHYLTVGQVAFMNLADVSWRNFPSASGRSCSTLAECPPRVFDERRQ